MGYLLNRRKTTRIIPRRNITCKAKNIAEVLGPYSWKDKRCFVICGGPSLEGFNFSLIQNELTIGINKAFLFHPVTINYSMDQRFYDDLTYSSRTNTGNKELHNAWLGYEGMKVFPKFDEKAKFDPSVYYVKTLSKACISRDITQGIFAGSNSGFGGMMLAISLGCKNIFMFGLDMKVDERRKKTHFHEGYPKQKIENVIKVLEKFKKEFEAFSGNIKKAGISVTNLNPNSGLTCFPRRDIREIL